MSSNTNIGNTPVNQGYVQLIHMGETGGIDGTLRALYDGDGTASDLLIASDKVKISTELYIGSKTLTEFVQDTVGAMFSSNTETNITVTYQDGDGTIDLVSSGEVTLTGSETLTNKTLTSPVINTGISGSAILDEDNMASNSATKLSTQQSIKAYVDTEVAGIVSSAPSTLDTLNELAAALGDDANFSTTVTNSIATKASLTGTETLTNKTLASPTFTGDVTFNDASTPQLNITDTTNTVSARVAASDTTVTFGSTTDNNVNIVRNDVGHFTLYSNYTMHNNGGNDVDFRVKDSSGNVVFKVDAGDSKTHITTLDVSGDADIDGTLETDALTIGGVTSVPFEAADHSKLDGIEASADVTDTANVTSAGALMDSEVDADIKTLSLPASTTISATAKTLLDDDSTTNMRTTLGLEIGTNVQAYDAGLQSISGLTTATNKMIYTTGSDTYAVTTLSATARTLLDDNTTADMLTTLGLTATAELNYTDGVTSNIQTQLGTKVPTTRTITPVSQRGISGGGDLSADRTFELSSSQLDQVTLNAADNLILFDNSDNDIPKRFIAQDIFDSLGGITIDGTTANGVLTYGGTNNIDTESELTYSAGTLQIHRTSGNSVLKIRSDDSNPRIYFAEGSTVKANIGYSISNNRFELYNGSATPFSIEDGAGNNTLVVDSNSRVGIGTTSPAQKVDISDTRPVLRLTDSSSGTADTAIGTIEFYSADTSGNYPAVGASIKAMTESSFGSGHGLAFLTNADSASPTERMRIDEQGNVGIGTTSPSLKLDVAGDIGLKNNATYLYSKDASGTSTRMFGINGSNNTYIGPIDNYAGGSILYGANANVVDHIFYTGGAERMRIKTSTGNVGIGTGSPDANLVVASSSGATIKLQDTGSHAFSLVCENNSNFLNFKEGGGTSILSIDGSNQRVGIGTASPDTLLHLNEDDSAVAFKVTGGSGGAKIASFVRDVGVADPYAETYIHASGADPQVTFRSSANQYFSMGIDLSASSFKISEHSSIGTDDRLTIDTSGTTELKRDAGHAQNTVLVIKSDDPNGDQGASSSADIDFHIWDINTRLSTPQARIGIRGDGTANQDNEAGGTLSFYTNIENYSSPSLTEALRIDNTQDAHFDQDVIAFSTTPSDIRLKENFTKIENGLDVVSKLEGHTFNWKKGGDRLSAGFKAQEVEKILPHLVDEKKLPLKADDDKEYKILRYEEMIPYLVEAIKEQQNQINELKGIING